MSVTRPLCALCALLLTSLACAPSRGDDIVAQDPDRFSAAAFDPPPGMEWVECRTERLVVAGGVAGPAPERIRHPNGHAVDVGRDAVSGMRIFGIIEPPSPNVVVQVNAGPGQSFGGQGLHLVLSWMERDGCEVPEGSVIARIRPGQEADPLRSEIDLRTRSIRTTEPLFELSTFAIAR